MSFLFTFSAVAQAWSNHLTEDHTHPTHFDPQMPAFYIYNIVTATGGNDGEGAGGPSPDIKSDSLSLPERCEFPVKQQ